MGNEAKVLNFSASGGTSSGTPSPAGEGRFAGIFSIKVSISLV